MNISWRKFIIGEDILFTSLLNTQPKNLYNQLDNNIMIPHKYINIAHQYYFGYNLSDINDEFTNLLSLIPRENFQSVTDNTITKEEYSRLYYNKFSEINPDLRKIINEQKSLINMRNSTPTPLLISETAKFLLSIDPNVDLSRLNGVLNNNLRDIRDIINEQIGYLKYESDCQKIFIIVFLNNIPMGGVVIFYNPNYLDIHGSHYIYIQGITKYPIIYLIDTLYPEYTSTWCQTPLRSSGGCL